MFPTIASQFGDPGDHPGVRRRSCGCSPSAPGDGGRAVGAADGLDVRESSATAMIPVARIGYLAEIAAARRAI